MNIEKMNSCSPKLLAITEKTGEVFQFAIFALSWSGIPRTLLQLGHTACGIEVSILHYFVMVNLLDFIGRHLLSPVSKIQIPNETLRDGHNLVSTR